MSRGFPLSHTADIDNPWHRLPWTLPTALLIWTVALVGLAYFMAKPTQQPVELPPIDAQLLEQSVPAAAHERPSAVRKSKLLPQIRPQQTPENPHTEQDPAARKAAVTTTNPAVSLPAAAAPGGAQATSGEGLATGTGKTSANSGAQAGSYDGKGPTRGSIYASSGARAIVQPMPQIPDDLREGAFNSAALARFHIAVDGSATVELAKPTPNPRLNRILLDSLRKWRFIPAIKNAKPVASTEEIIVKIEVK